MIHRTALTLTFSLLAATANADEPALSLAGKWTDPGGTVVTITGDGGKFSVAYAGGRGPFAGEFLKSRKIEVKFTDDKGCCTGNVVGVSTIQWSNNTTWKRVPNPELAVGRWTDASGASAEVKSLTKGYEITLGGKTLAGALVEPRKLEAKLGAEPGCCVGRFDGDDTIRWSNGAVWSRAKDVSIAGAWIDGAGASIAVMASGGGYQVKFASGRGPFVGRHLGPTKVEVKFTDDGNCCTAELDGETLKWSNGTSWRRRPPLAGQWSDGASTFTIAPDGMDLAIQREGKPALVAKHLDPLRLEAKLSDAPGCCTGAIEGTDTIRWSSGVTWRRQASLAGRWSDGVNTVTVAVGPGGYTVKYDSGRGPFAGKAVGERGVEVKFTDDGGCCTGQVEQGDVIKWSNGTTWRRLK